MVRQHGIKGLDRPLLADRFEPAKALRKAMGRLLWQRRLWRMASVAAWLLTVSALACLCFNALFFARFALSPAPLLVALQLSTAFAILGVVFVLVMAVRWWWHESLFRATADADALLDGDMLRNALDLAKLRDDEPFVSPLFARAAIWRAWQRWQSAATNGIAHRLTLPHRRHAALSWLLALPFAVVALLVTMRSGVSVPAFIALYRDAQAVLAFERHGKLRLQLSDADGVVLKGTSVTVTAEAEGGKATLVRLRWETPKGTHWLVMQPVGDNRFAAELVVTESGKLQAICGRIKSPSVSLLAVLPPRISEWLVSVEPPDYAGLPAESFAELPSPLRLLKGTKVTVTATASSVLSDAQLFCEPKTSADVATDGQQVTVRFTVRQPFHWRLRLRDRYGFDGLTSWQRVEVQPDDPPKVAVLTGVKAVVAGGFAPLTVRAEDDFGVRQLALQFAVGEPNRPPSRWQTVTLPIPTGTMVEQSLALPVPVTAVGKSFWVRGRAEDNDAVSGPKVGVSAWLELPIRAPDELLGTPDEWLRRLRQLEAWLQQRDWQTAQTQVERWQQWWQEQWQQAQWANQPLPQAWLQEWLQHLTEHLRRRDLTAALNELWQMQRALERAMGEERLTELAQEAARLRAMQESLLRSLQRGTPPTSLAASQEQLADRTERLRQALQDEAKRWADLGNADIAFQLRDAAKVLAQRPTAEAMRQAAAAMRQEQTAIAQSKGNDALSDLRELEERLTSPTQNPLAQLYRQERNLLAQLLEQTERLRRDQANLRQQTETSASQQVGKSANEGRRAEQPSIRTPATSVNPLSPPMPPSWGEVERLTPERPQPSPSAQRHPPNLPEQQRQLRQRAEGLRHPLQEAMERVPQLPPETPHRLQDAIEQMDQAEQALRQNERQRASQSQRRAEEALQQLSEVLRQALQSEQGSLSQRMGAGENEAMALARRQTQLLRRTQQLHARRQQGQRPNPSELQAMGAEEGSIRQALSRMEGFFGEALPPELRQRMGQAQEWLQWLEQNLPQGETGQETQGRQQRVLETLLQLAQALSGQQGNQQGQQRQQQQQQIAGQMPAMPDINWGRFIEHGPPMRQVPEALQGAKGGAAFVERAKPINPPPPSPLSVPRLAVPPAYRDAVQKYQRRK
jgi:hypothetical protein